MNQSVGGAIGRIIGVFAVVGMGLGLGGLLFLWVTDYFKPSNNGDFGSSFVGGLTIAALLIFALLIGVVIAAFGGMHAANKVEGRSGAVSAGLVAGSLGHVLMVAILAGIMVTGIQFLSANETAGSDASPSPASEPSPTPDESCIAEFGADSPLCSPPQIPKAIEPPQVDSTESGVRWESFLKIGLGFIPAALVGALTAALLYSRRS